MNQEVLEKIGLTRKEAEVYQTLLRLGEVPIVEVLKETKSHPQVIYSVVERLTQKGLLSKFERNHKAYIQAESPERLVQIENNRLADLKNALPSLLAIQKKSPETMVKVLKGNQAIRDLKFQIVQDLKRGDTEYILNAAGLSYKEAMGVYFEEYDRRRIKKGINKKYLTYESQRSFTEKYHKLKLFAQYKYLPKYYQVPSSSIIFKNTVALIIWEKDPIIIKIESKNVATSYLQHFELLWQIAQE